MLCWFQGGLTDSFGNLQYLQDGLGLLRGTACPHHDGDPGRRPAFQEMVARGAPSDYADDDGAALHFAGSRFKEAVSSRQTARAYRIVRKHGEAVEMPLDTRYLGAKLQRARSWRPGQHSDCTKSTHCPSWCNE